MYLDASELAEPVPGVESFVDTADGTRLRTLVAGEGPAVVFAHG